MFFQKRNRRFYPKIAASARRGERNDREGFTFVKMALRISDHGYQATQRADQECCLHRRLASRIFHSFSPLTRGGIEPVEP